MMSGKGNSADREMGQTGDEQAVDRTHDDRAG